jgi:hypothetical protein
MKNIISYTYDSEKESCGDLGGKYICSNLKINFKRLKNVFKIYKKEPLSNLEIINKL